MLQYALLFLVIAIIAGVLGFGGVAGAASGIAQILFFMFLAFLVVSLIIGCSGAPPSVHPNSDRPCRVRGSEVATAPLLMARGRLLCEPGNQSLARRRGFALLCCDAPAVLHARRRNHRPVQVLRRA